MLHNDSSFSSTALVSDFQNLAEYVNSKFDILFEKIDHMGTQTSNVEESDSNQRTRARNFYNSRYDQ